MAGSTARTVKGKNAISEALDWGGRAQFDSGWLDVQSDADDHGTATFVFIDGVDHAKSYYSSVKMQLTSF